MLSSRQFLTTKFKLRHRLLKRLIRRQKPEIGVAFDPQQRGHRHDGLVVRHPDGHPKKIATSCHSHIVADTYWTFTFRPSRQPISHKKFLPALLILRCSNRLLPIRVVLFPEQFAYTAQFSLTDRNGKRVDRFTKVLASGILDGARRPHESRFNHSPDRPTR